MKKRKIRKQLKTVRAILKRHEPEDRAIRYRFYLQIDQEYDTDFLKYACRNLPGLNCENGDYLLAVKLWAYDDEEAEWLLNKFADELHVRLGAN